ncbi:MAG TPA: lipopolysaccharide biosynthesis protein [Candidatus Deferrimicrobium sp.]|nr:lipopolysaccharide biosynthesis protein [Candidatus Deferrimicrobium sp.]
MLITGAINVILRGLTLSGKFVLLLFLARYFSPEELGVFGLMSVTIAIALYVLGLDFYVYNTREILSRNPHQCAPFVRDQVVFHGIVYALTLPLLLGVFVSGTIAWKYLGWFYLLLVLEHLSQEANRLLITLSRSTMANVVLFLRSGAWVFVAAGVAIFADDKRSLPFLWSAWAVGVVASLGLTAYALRDVAWKELKGVRTNWGWIRNGTRVALPFFAATASLMGIQYADRYFLQHYYGESTVGVYTFYAQVSNAIQIFVFAGVISVLYPRIVAAYQQGRLSEYRLLVRKLSLGVGVSVLLLVGACAIAIKPILALVGKAVYGSQVGVFWIMLASGALLSCSYIPHYVLFAKRRDRDIIASTGIALAVALVANSLLVPRYGLHGAAWASATAMAVLAGLKVALAFRSRRDSRTVEGVEPKGVIQPVLTK